MIVIRILMLAAFLFLFPFLLGTPWTTLLPRKNRYRLLSCFPIGFFVEIAIFQLLEVPIAFLHLPFTLLCWVFSAVIVGTCIYGIVFIWKQKPFIIILPKLNRWESFYLIAFIGLLGVQLYNGFVRDTTYWSYDDAAYVTYAADTVRYNAIQTIDPYTGIATMLNVHRTLQGWLYFPAFLSRLSSIPVAIMERTILEAYDILLAYTVYGYMASVLFSRRDNGLIFMILLSMLHIFGYYSPYSITFRLLGPNYQGKAVLSVSFFPLLFTFLMQILQRRYSRICGVLLMLFSVAATTFTLFGAVTMVLNTSLVVGLSVLNGKADGKHKKRLKYILWACFMPTLYCGIYLLCKYGQF